MAARTLILATALALGLPGLAQAEIRSTWQEPETRAAEAPAPRVQQVQAGTRDAGPGRQDAETPPSTRGDAQASRGRGGAEAREAQAPRRAQARAERRGEVRSARYKGGAGSTWKTGRDSHGFAGTYGGCSFRGFAGPNGYKLDRRC